MREPPQPCPGERELRALAAGSLPAGQRQRVRGHVVTCVGCRALLDSLEATHRDPPPPEELGRIATEADPTVPFTPVPGMPEREGIAAGEETEEDDLGFLKPSNYPGSRGRLAQYEVLGILGRGGMGLVLKGFDPDLRRVVAIKVLASRLAVSPRARRRFAREARAAAAINDPHVVTIHAVGEANDVPYLVMECIPGQTLQERIRRGPRLSILEVLRITHQVAKGLQAAHTKAVIHRDIKPGNIMLEDSQARVKITDFGVALAAEGLGDASSADAMVGTPEYMSPEQVRGEDVDARSDLFSLGCVIHAMVAGKSPFRGATLVDTIRRVTDQSPASLLDVDASVPAGLAELADRLLRKDPPQRPASAQEVVEAVESLLARQPAPIDSVENPDPPAIAPAIPGANDDQALARTQPRRRRWFSVLAVCLGVLGAVGWAIRWWQGDGGGAASLPDRAPAPGRLGPTDSIRPAEPRPPVLTLSRDGTADYSSLAVAISRIKAPGTTIRILDGGEYGGPIVLKHSDVYQGLTIEAAGPSRPTVSAPGRQNAVLTIDGIAGVTLRGLTLRSRAEQFALSIGGFSPGLTLADLDLTKGEPAPEVGFWSHVWMGNAAHGDPGAPITFERCRFRRWPTGLVFQGNAGALISQVLVRGCRFETRLRQLELISPARNIRIVDNLFLDGQSGIVLDSLAGDSGGITISNNTFWRVPRWLDPTRSAANLAGMAVFNNAILESSIPGELCEKLAALAASWSFHHNVAEARGVSSAASAGMVEEVADARVESRDPETGGSSFLRPLPESALARAGAGGSDPVHVGAVRPARP